MHQMKALLKECQEKEIYWWVRVKSIPFGKWLFNSVAPVESFRFSLAYLSQKISVKLFRVSQKIPVDFLVFLIDSENT